MSAIAAVVSSGAVGDLAPVIDRLLSAMPPAGQTRAVSCRAGMALGVMRLDWESPSDFRGPAEIVSDGRLVVAADAALYYRDDLVARLREARVEPAGATPGHLILAAYRAWGESCVRYLEGDFAFVLVDESRSTVFAARDIFGRRGLYYAALENALVMASTISAVVAHPSCPRDLDKDALVRGFAFMMSRPDGTPYRAVRAVPPASCLTRGPDGVVRITPYWHVPDTDAVVSGSSFDDARLELRELLARSVAERLAPSGPTALWLSGGYDSPALYAAGKSRLRASGDVERLRPVSVSFPPGDPGREDELIDDIVRYWGDSATWLHIDQIPLLHAIGERAAAADQPSAHAVESFFGALFAASGELGARVALQADGGDQLFAVSTVFLSDLFAQGRWREMWREWLAHGGAQQGFRDFLNTVARPVLTRSMALGAQSRKLRVAPPEWIRPDWLAQSGIVDDELAADAALRRRCRTLAGLETLGALSHPILPRVAAAFATVGMTHGVEMRAPLLDRRIVEFALRRPRRERASLGEVKRLLRAAGRDLLPESVLSPRRTRTGMLTGYFRRSFIEDPNGLIEDTFRRPILADLGVVDRDALLRAWHALRNGGDTTVGGPLFGTLHTELWLRARMSGDMAAHSSL